MIYLFTSVTCQPCTQAKEWLTNKGVEYTIVDIDDDPKEAKKHGIMKLPTLLVIHDAEKYYIPGYHRNKWLALLRDTGAIK